jgi:hypothetical protein
LLEIFFAYPHLRCVPPNHQPHQQSNHQPSSYQYFDLSSHFPRVAFQCRQSCFLSI